MSVFTASALLMMVVAAWAPQGSEGPSTFVVTATVLPLNEHDARAAKAVPITYDARFLFRARIESVVSGSPPWKPGQILDFSIHSPTRTFRGTKVEGRRVKLTFREKDPKPGLNGPQPGPFEDCVYCLSGLELEAAPSPSPSTVASPHGTDAR